LALVVPVIFPRQESPGLTSNRPEEGYAEQRPAHEAHRHDAGSPERRPCAFVIVKAARSPKGSRTVDFCPKMSIRASD
jgi:hypothetical protein